MASEFFFTELLPSILLALSALLILAAYVLGISGRFDARARTQVAKPAKPAAPVRVQAPRAAPQPAKVAPLPAVTHAKTAGRSNVAAGAFRVVKQPAPAAPAQMPVELDDAFDDAPTRIVDSYRIRARTA